MNTESDIIVNTYLSHIANRDFPCVGAKTALAKSQVQWLVADHLAYPNDDRVILSFLYGFVDLYRASDSLYHSAVIFFNEPRELEEELFDQLMWQRLQSLSDLDAINYPYDKRVSADPQSANFSFSIKAEGFYILGLHPSSSRQARRFQYPALVFNPHKQFEQLRETHKYDSLKKAIRSRDKALSGSVNPMLSDFGEQSEVFQYSGRNYDSNWKCPFISRHRKPEDHSAA